jgi:hypothetical protein
MDLLKQAMIYALLIALLYALVIGVRHFAHVHVPSGFSDISGLEEFSSYGVDRTVTLAQLRPGDAVCYYVDGREEASLCFGWIIALPGDEVGVSQGLPLLNGKPESHGDKLDSPDLSGVRIPAHHVWVVSDHHYSDSFALGPIPAIAIYGRLAHLP